MSEASPIEILSGESCTLKCGLLKITTSVFFFIEFEPVSGHPLANFTNAIFKFFNGKCKNFHQKGQRLHTTVYHLHTYDTGDAVA